MKCPNCGAEVSGNVCEFCGSQLSTGTNQKAHCSNCGSTNITFKRENAGEYKVKGKNAKRVVHRTVGYCKDCGNTWYIGDDIPKKRKTWLWVLGWIFIFPLPLTILMLRKKEMKPAIKYGIIAVAWVLYLVIALTYKPNEDKKVDTVNPTETIAPAQIKDTTKAEKPAKSEESTKTELLSFVLKDGETGEYGLEVILNKDTEFEEHEIAYHLPAGTYTVENLNSKGAGQVSVYCGGPEKNGEWEEFVADDNCARPIVVMAGESKELVIKDGQFVVLSDETSNIQFTLK